MFLTTVTDSEFLKFFQILCWIFIPFLGIALLSATYMHYRNNSRAPGKMEKDLLSCDPENLGYTKGDGEYVYFDHSEIIQAYKKSLSVEKARVAALEADIADLEEQCNTLGAIAGEAVSIQEKLNQVEAKNIMLESQLATQNRQQELLQASAADSIRMVELLQQKLDQEQSVSNTLRAALEDQSRVMENHYRTSQILSQDFGGDSRHLALEKDYNGGEGRKISPLPAY